MMRVPRRPIPHLARAAGIRPLACILALVALGLAACAPMPHATPGADQAGTGRGPAVVADTVDLVLLSTTDVHGRLVHHDYYTGQPTDYGLSLLLPLIDSVRAENPGRTFLFDSGDLLQGNPLAYLHARVEPDGPNPVIRAMNLAGYTAAAIGNHEFNYGLEHLDRAIAEARFPFVSANIYRHGTDRHAYTPYALIPYAVGGADTIVLGVTGNTPPGVHIWDRGHVEGVLEFRDIVAAHARVVREMRGRGADLIIILSHGGFEGTSYDTLASGLTAENVAARVAREVPGVDVILLGHSHRELADSTINGVLFTQARNWAQSLAAATVRMARGRDGGWSVVAKHATLLRPDPARADTAFLDSIADVHRRTLAYVGSVVGHAAAPMSARTARVEDTPILDFINEVQRRAAGTELSAAAAFTLRAELREGPVTIADLAGLYIYDNTLKAVRISGAQLRAFLEKSAEYYNGWPPPPGGTVTNFDRPGYNFDAVSGVDYTLDLRRPVGERVVELRYRGEPVRPDQTFTMAVNNYRQAGGGGFSMLADAPVVHDRQEDIRELLIEEVRRRGTIRPDEDFRRNWRIIPEEAAAAAAREQAARELTGPRAVLPLPGAPRAGAPETRSNGRAPSYAAPGIRPATSPGHPRAPGSSPIEREKVTRP